MSIWSRIFGGRDKSLPDQPTEPEPSPTVASRLGLGEHNTFEFLRPEGTALCSDNSCPCGYPGAEILVGEGYLLVSQVVVDFRDDARSLEEARDKAGRLMDEHAARGEYLMNIESIVSPVLACGLSLEDKPVSKALARTAAKFWWETGRVALFSTMRPSEFGEA